MSKPFNPFRLFVGSFTPNWLMRRKELSAAAKLLYGRLMQYAGEKGYCFPRQSILARELGLSKKSVLRHLQELEKAGLIEKRRRGQMRSNVYLFLWREDWMDAPLKGHFDTSRGDKLALQEVPNWHFTNNKRIREKNQDNHTASVDAGNGRSFPTPSGRRLNGRNLEAFLRFWEAFNYKRGKAEAAEAWLESGPMNAELADKIIAAAGKEARARKNWLEKGMKPKMAAGWLMARRWEDEHQSPGEGLEQETEKRRQRQPEHRPRPEEVRLTVEEMRAIRRQKMKPAP